MPAGGGALLQFEDDSRADALTAVAAGNHEIVDLGNPISVKGRVCERHSKEP